MKQNRLVISAVLRSKEPLRYSPAGVPIQNCRLAHQSEQMEAGSMRSVTCEIPAVAVGPLAQKLAASELESVLECSGFLATKRRYETAELHIVEFSESRVPGIEAPRATV